jgi:hypothetical protein
LGGFDYHLALSIALWNDNKYEVNKKIDETILSFILKVMKERYKKRF